MTEYQMPERPVRVVLEGRPEEIEFYKRLLMYFFRNRAEDVESSTANSFLICPRARND